MIATAAVALSVLLPATVAATGTLNLLYNADPLTDVCATGMMQSPIDLPGDSGSLPHVPTNLVTDVKMPIIHSPVTKNVGIAMHVTWDPITAFDMANDTIFPIVAAGGESISDVLLTGAPADRRLKMIPLEIHWLNGSEHSVDGLLAPIEARIVTAVAPGEAPAEWGCDAVWEGGAAVPEKCFAVFGILFNISPDAVTPPAIEWLFNSFPEVVGAEAPYPDVTLDLNELLPLDKSYDTYIGSLTTPPCTEGLRWHVFTNAVPVSLATVMRFESLMAATTDLETGEMQNSSRPVQPLNGRTIWHHNATVPQQLERPVERSYVVSAHEVFAGRYGHRY